jgi:tRNA nucleotidyltransferase/poly(A) polymerase
MVDVLTRIEDAKAKIKKAEAARIQAETEKGLAEKQQAELIKQMEAEGVSPETIVQEIEKLELLILEKLSVVESKLPDL